MHIRPSGNNITKKNGFRVRLPYASLGNVAISSIMVGVFLGVLSSPSQGELMIQGENMTEECITISQNVRAIWSESVKKALRNISFSKDAISDFREFKVELKDDMTWFGADVTDDTILNTAMVAQATLTAAKLSQNLLELAPGSQFAKLPATIEEIIFDYLKKTQGMLDENAEKIFYDLVIKKLDEITGYPKVVQYVKIIVELTADIEKLRNLPGEHKRLKNNINKQMENLDRYLRMYEARRDSAYSVISDYSEQLLAVKRYCELDTEPYVLDIIPSYEDIRQGVHESTFQRQQPNLQNKKHTQNRSCQKAREQIRVYDTYASNITNAQVMKQVNAARNEQLKWIYQNCSK